jgi:hypothetical protein
MAFTIEYEPVPTFEPAPCVKRPRYVKPKRLTKKQRSRIASKAADKAWATIHARKRRKR